jgi:hypothetical protein
MPGVLAKVRATAVLEEKKDQHKYTALSRDTEVTIDPRIMANRESPYITAHIPRESQPSPSSLHARSQSLAERDLKRHLDILFTDKRRNFSKCMCIDEYQMVVVVWVKAITQSLQERERYQRDPNHRTFLSFESTSPEPQGHVIFFCSDLCRTHS